MGKLDGVVEALDTSDGFDKMTTVLYDSRSFTRFVHLLFKASR